MDRLPVNELIHGSCHKEMKHLQDESVNCVVTSPPYWALRDYGVAGQLGLEPTFQEYISKLCDIFDEVKRVLKKDGTCWVNLGDTYSGMNVGNTECYKNPNVETKSFIKQKQNIQDKCLLQIPSRFSIEMCNRGWILRNTIIWHKPNCMPSSVKDRFTVDYEYVFFFVKNKQYWFDTQYEPMKEESSARYKYDFTGNAEGDGKLTLKEPKGKLKPSIKGRNKRCVWKITTKPYKEAHFAVFPEELVETPIKAGCPKCGVVLDPFCGSGTTGVVAKKLGMNFIGIDLNSEYIKIANKRIDNTQGSLF